MQVPVSAAKLTHSHTQEISNSVGIDRLDIASFREQALDSDKAEKLAEFFSWLNDPARLQILSLLAQRDLGVNDLAEILEVNEAVIVERLEILRSHKLVGYSNRGGKIYYRLLDRHVLNLYKSVVEHLNAINLEISETKI